ncbi:hypothetical protein A11A3_04295 [Alcanivorax hongdengensis A-11-3]|uniref:DUF3617 domain-containing protein n=1 Tax=Alcanivorax hongdengensis A-11-3 TaxID=1177179 RepID=L0WEL4_9GAMM|nr:DUF3617 domain-containing protein [Alcanivorax hongdengensis]EKF75169.1 hypothetical protein A11A3_04295 [Alcanivorax hongdengensis A-11-3]
MKRFITLASAATLLCIAMPAAQALELKPGLWKQEITMDAPNLPKQMRTRQSTHCITQEQASDPKMAMKKSWGESQCQPDKLDQSGNTLTWSATCKTGKFDSHMHGSMTFVDATHYTTQTDVEANGHSMKSTVKGSWLKASCDQAGQ